MIDELPATELPIESRLEAVCDALARHNRALLVAQPGAGKTTRVPLALLQQPWCQGSKLLLLEPRRVAARLAAGFMADMLGETLGETVGYRMRGESRVGPNTRLEVVTQGVLTRVLQDDPMLEGVAGILFDEFHERSLDADLGLALTLDVQQGLREDLRLLVMSATLDVEALRQVLGADTPLIDCPGRQYPVSTHYRPLNQRKELAAQQAEVVEEALATSGGDVLVILPGVAEIHRLERELQRRQPEVPLKPLHGRLPLSEQRDALMPVVGQRVVLATAIAESSVTVNGVKAVVDAGLERVPVFQARSGLTRLETRRVNRASADQRRGRAGRQGSGWCFRLWAEEQPLVAHAEPEMRQSDLAPLAFELARWGVAQPEQLSWVTPPAKGVLEAGRDLLKRLGVLDDKHQLTQLGRRCARWPVHPRLAVMLERAGQFDAQPLACALAALLEGGDRQREPDLAKAVQQRLNELRDYQWQSDYRQWQRDAKRLARLAGCALEVTNVTAMGALLALAYPERIAQRLEPGRFRLAGGGLASLAVEHPLAHAAFLVAVELDGDPSQARIFKAAALEQQRLEALYPEARHWQTRLEWSATQGRLLGEEVQALGAVILARRPLSKLPAEAIRSALLEALRRRGTLVLDERSQQLLGRMALLRREQGDQWPDWSQAALLETLEDWLSPRLDGISRLDAVDRLPLATFLLESLPWSLRTRMEELVPDRLAVPSGSQVRLDYTACSEGNDPVLAVKLQEVFGWQSSPCVVQGRVGVVLHLLSPARRPLQVTRDLASFWSNGYVEVRKEMRGRYPKHPWPADPLNAPASARTKRRS
ncbi:ATP-dependent helicase HrpB [Halomonas sp. ZH2S]|uniref:ATP-dependent helicase HrpB n=1 Tax=Vreelandella zhuhanensis TaxID=2684210 RepID=A0A7X3GXP4_9GAMM|nr:ATP-dependent helicase HrpB [Halomonas zhuhanensis]MWJ26661.1 ATP-dependent helicase HrpB [Halomonas zhuhanensis]